MNATDRLLHWIRERHSIYVKKQSGKPKPWTQDEILQQYRFCNVYRELDTVTVWIKDNWRSPNANHPNLWFSMVVARLLNLPDTLGELGFPLPWQPSKFLTTIASRTKRGLPSFNGAYIVSTNGHKMAKPQYLVEHVLNPLYTARKDLRPTEQDTLESYCDRISQFDGIGAFIAGQVVADLKNCKGCPLSTAADWWTWASPGPGSKRGLNRVLGQPVDLPWGREWFTKLKELHTTVQKQLKEMPRLHAQDLQNCLCEFDKYERVRLGEGRPKRKYNGCV